MATNFIWAPGSSNDGLLTTAVSLMTTELQSLTNTSVIISSVNGSSGVFTNSNTGQAMVGEIFWNVGNPGVGSSLSSGANIAGWFLTSWDSGTTYEQTSVAPSRPPDFIIPLPATTITASTTYKASGPIMIPALKFKVIVQNNTGQTLGNGGTTAPSLKLAPFAMQY